MTKNSFRAYFVCLLLIFMGPSCGQTGPSVAQSELNGIWTTGCVPVLNVISVRSDYRFSGGDLEQITETFTDPGCSLSPTITTSYYSNSISGGNAAVTDATNIDSTLTSQKTCSDGVCSSTTIEPKVIYLGLYKIQGDNLFISWGSGKSEPAEKDRATSLSGAITKVK